MANYRAIMEMVLAERTYREIVEAVGCSRREVSRVKQILVDEDIGDVSSVTDTQLREWFPDGRRRISDEYAQPDFDRVLVSMKNNRHFTQLLAWRRYANAKDPGKKYAYSQFNALFVDYLRTNDLVAVLHHEPGRAMHVDWAGDSLDLVDMASGEITSAYLFVAVLPYSGALFCHAFMSMKSPSWLDGHVRAFNHFGGVVQIVIPDNPLTSTHPKTKGERQRVINARYQQLADHYQTAIVPARARTPRDKAAVESGVNVVNKRVIGYLEEETWTSLAELNEAISERVWEINHDLTRADGSTRWQQLEAEEADLLKALPDARFEEVEWKQAKAGRNYHVTADYGRYSVPYTLAGKLLRVRLETTRVTIFDGHDLVCEHRRLLGRKGQYSTLPEHVPPQHRDIDGLWSRRWFTDQAARFGPATVAVIEQILDRHVIEAQSYHDCQNILSGLGKNNRERLEAACQELVNRGGHGSYSMLKRIMASIDSDTKKPRPKIPLASRSQREAPVTSGPDVFVRDISHYADEGDPR